MNFLKKYISVFVFIVLAGFVYHLSGCASAELTTGKLAFKEGDFQKAAVELARGLQIDKNDAEGWYMLGYSQIEIGKYEEARVSFQRSLALSPNYANDILGLWIEKYNSGINNFNAGLTSLGSADSLGAERNFNNALNNFFATTSIIPDSASSYQMIADTYFYLGKNDSALIVYESILDRTASESDAVQIARILYENGIKARQDEKYEEALTIFKKVPGIKYLPKDNQFYEVSVFNIAYANYMIASKLIQENPDTDYKPYMTEIITYLEPLAESSNNKDILIDTLELLIVAYDAMGLTDKKEQAEARRQSLMD